MFALGFYARISSAVQHCVFKMRSHLNVSLILLLSACLLAPVNAQTTNPAVPNKVGFRDVKRLGSAPQSPEQLREVTAELSGRLVGQPPNVSIEFVLTLQNNGSQQIKILDPLNSFRLQLAATDGKSIPLPDRFPKGLPLIGLPKDAPLSTNREAPYPAPVQFREMASANRVSSQKEETITILPGAKIKIVFETEPVVMERVTQTLGTETGEHLSSFKARAILGLLSAPPQANVGGRLLDSDWIFFTIPSS
jgi:hypothetical protein